jgi:hypothetical protein
VQAPTAPGLSFAHAVRSLALDVAGVSVIASLERNGVQPLLLKGPALVKRLRSHERVYVDIDLLVEPGDIAAAEATLAELGFEHAPLDTIPGDRPWHARYWHRAGDGAGIDLHRTLIGVRCSPGRCWTVLSERVAPMVLAGREVRALDDAGIALHAALHAAQDGVRLRRPLRDLEIALERLPLGAWRESYLLAQALDAEPAFVAGLRLCAAGDALADRLGLGGVDDLETRLRAQGDAERALGLHWLLAQRGLGSKARLVAAKVAPRPAFMRAWAPSFARHGHLGLAFAYAWRPVWLLGQLVPAYRRRRALRRSGPNELGVPGPPDELAEKRLEALFTPIDEVDWGKKRSLPSLLDTSWKAFFELRRAVASRVFEHGMDTTETSLELEHFHTDRSQYSPSGWQFLRKALKVVPAGPDEVFLDFGSGKGRVVYQAAKRPFKRVIGVEVSPVLNDVARRNIERVRPRLRCQDVELVACDALDYRIPDDLTVAYFYHPFTGETFRRVIANIVESLERRPRRFDVIYVCPQNERLLLDSGFRCLKRWGGGWRYDDPLRRIAVYRRELTIGPR